MRLINTSTRLFEEFITRNIPTYAILSHTWREEEVTYKDYVEGRYATMHGFGKIDMTCQLAKRAGIRYCWVDTCCIDKSSSAELTEAINSMYAWYKNAHICYTYLEDLISGVDVSVELSKCRWYVYSSQADSVHMLTCRFTRGWTLQELIAPRNVVFYNGVWDRVGDKQQLAFLLCTITGIEEGILRKEYELEFVPVAVRMSWAAKRQTTRVEDTAYCLLGIFNVNLPLLYGEQEKAFQRLQEEIIRSTPDLSIFAWCYLHPFYDSDMAAQNMLSGVLAESPTEFVDCGTIKLMHQTDLREVAFTNIGIRTRLRTLFSKSQNHGYVLPLNCYSTVTGGSLGIRLCKVGREQYLRQNPYKLLEYATGTLEDKRPVERYLLTYIPSITGRPGRFQPIHVLNKLQPNVVCIKSLPPGVHVLDIWPSDCWDDARQVFFLAGDPRWDSFQMKLTIKYKTTDDDGFDLSLDFDFVLYALGWSNTAGEIPNPDSFGLVDYRQYRDEADEIRQWMKEKDANTASLSKLFDAFRMPKMDSITFDLLGTLRSLVLGIDANSRSYVKLTVNERPTKDIQLDVIQKWQVYSD
jgi:hypothetical protein